MLKPGEHGLPPSVDFIVPHGIPEPGRQILRYLRHGKRLDPYHGDVLQRFLKKSLARFSATRGNLPQA